MANKEFRSYVAAAKINIGVDKETSIAVDKGTVVEYNGTVAIIEGEEYNFPKLSSAIKARWLVDTEELGINTAGPYQPQSAHITMSAATPQQKDVVASRATIAEEDREVSSVQAFRSGEQRDAQQHHVQQQQQQQQQVPQHRPPSAGFRNQMVLEPQGGEEVRGVSFTTKAGSESLKDSFRTDQVSQNATQEGNSNAKLAQFQELERQKMEREIAALKQQLQQQAPQEQVQVREGIQFRTEGISENAAGTTPQTASNLPEGIWDGHGADVVGQVTKQAQAQAPQQAPQVPQAPEYVTPEISVEDKESRLAFARQMMPNFDWDFGQHWKTKLKSLETNANPLFVCTVYAVESDAMKVHIASQFPDLNLGG